ncbi:MAG: biopolymer transporter ExbD [Planctomycetota bacterium]
MNDAESHPSRHDRPPLRARRVSHDVRLELMPLLDVVFLLLTFFIYAMAVMVRVEALEVGLSPVAGQGGPGDAVEHVLRIEADGQLTYNDESLASDALGPLLETLAGDEARPRLFVALTETDTTTATDRSPVMWRILQSIESAGLENVAIVGRPAE